MVKVVNTPQVKDGLYAEKLDWLRVTVATLKKERKLSQRVIAERIGDREGEFSDRLHGRRGIPDTFIDAFQRAFGVMFKPSTRAADPINQEAELVKMIEGLTNDLREATQALRQDREQMIAMNKMMGLMAENIQAQGVDLRGLRQDFASLAAQLKTSLQE